MVTCILQKKKKKKATKTIKRSDGRCGIWCHITKEGLLSAILHRGTYCEEGSVSVDGGGCGDEDSVVVVVVW